MVSPRILVYCQIMIQYKLYHLGVLPILVLEISPSVFYLFSRWEFCFTLAGRGMWRHLHVFRYSDTLCATETRLRPSLEIGS